MRWHLENRLRKDFPTVFSLGPESRWSIALFGIECADGWEALIRKLCVLAEKEGLVANQIKEKFGGLRFYTDRSGSEAFESALRQAEADSFKTCEECGVTNTAQTRPGGWIRTLCDSCWSMWQARKGV